MKRALIGVGVAAALYVAGWMIWNSNAEWCCEIQYNLVWLMCRLGI